MHIIRKADEASAASIWQVIEQVWTESSLNTEKKAALFTELEAKHSVTQIAADIALGRKDYLLVLKDEEIIAFASFSWDRVYPAQLDIRQLYDLGHYNLSQYLIDLMSRIEAFAQNAGAESIKVNLNNLFKHELFESLGFLPFDLHLKKILVDETNAYEMVKYLTYPKTLKSGIKP